MVASAFNIGENRLAFVAVEIDVHRIVKRSIALVDLIVEVVEPFGGVKCRDGTNENICCGRPPS